MSKHRDDYEYANGLWQPRRRVLRPKGLIPGVVAGGASGGPTTVIKGLTFISGTDYVQVASGFPHWENTQAWTVSAVTKFYGSAVAVVLTSAGSDPFPFPMEVFIDQSGFLNGRVVSNFTTNNYISVHGSTFLFDGNSHQLVVTYSGSKTAAGLKLYVDGVLETMTTDTDGLTGSSVNANPLWIGAQASADSGTGPPLHPFDRIAFVRVSNIARSGAFITANNSLTQGHAVDANTVLAYDFTEGSGTSTADSSGNNYTGTLSSSGIWTTWDTVIASGGLAPIQSVSGHEERFDTNPLTISFTGTTAGNAIILGVATFNGATCTVTVSDGTNSYSQAGGYVLGAFENSRLSIWYATNIAGGNITISITPSVNSYISAGAVEVANVNATPTVATANHPGTRGAYYASGKLTVGTKGSTCFAIAGEANDWSGGTPSVIAPFALGPVSLGAGQENIATAVAHGVQSDTEAVIKPFTTNVSGAILAASFSP